MHGGDAPIRSAVNELFGVASFSQDDRVDSNALWRDLSRAPARYCLATPHCLLAIHDPSGSADRRGPGDRPKETLALVADLRIDNRGEIGEALGLGGALSRLDDQQLLYKAWREWGRATLDRLVGDFALAVWDEPRRLLTLARDPTGQRPLHFRSTLRGAAFASMPRVLAGEGAGALSLERAVEYLGSVPDGVLPSFFESVDVVPPGGIVTISARGVTRERWWRPDPSPLRLSRDEAVEEASHLLRRAVQCQLRSTAPLVAAQLSGGLDSSAVVSFAAEALEQSDQRLLALTAAPGGPVRARPANRFHDEDRRAAELAALYPAVDHQIVRPRPRSLFDQLQANQHLMDRPVGNYCNGLWVDETYRAAAEAGADVMLVGLAGNFTFSFDGTLALPELFADRHWLRWARLASRYAGSGKVSWRHVLAQSIGPTMPGWLWRAALRFRRNPDFGPIEDRGLMRSGHPLVERMRSTAAAAGVDIDQRGTTDSSAFRLRALIDADPGNLNQAARRQWGVETRDPTADRRLVEFCLRLPAEHYFDGRRTRLLARRMLDGRIPRETVDEHRKGYQGLDWLESVELSRPAMEKEVAAIAADDRLRELFDLDRMRAMLADWPVDGWDNEVQIYAYRTKLMRGLTAAHWLRTGA